MADIFISDGFKWLWEFEYNAQYFAKVLPSLREALGHMGHDHSAAMHHIDMPHALPTAVDIIDGLLEHCNEIHVALLKLEEIVNG